MKVNFPPWLITTLALVLQASSLALAQPQTGKPLAKQVTEPAKPPEAKQPARSRVVTDLSGFDLRDPGRTKEHTMVAGATRGMPRATPLAPKLAKLYGRNPLFRWSYPGEMSKFVFVLMDDSHAELLRTDVSGTEFRYPTTAPQFAPGKTYFWTVEPAGTTLAQPSSPVGFVTMSAPQRQEMEQRLMSINSTDAYAAQCERAHVFTDQRLWYDAIGAYTDLIAQYPDRAELYEGRGSIYEQFQTTQALADNDFARVEELEARR
jgi:hypothetical protein